MKVFVGADHRGFSLRNSLVKHLKMAGYDVVDDGDKRLDPDDDFAVYAARVAKDVLANGPDARGILLCASGQGVCMAANRFKGIRACLGYDQETIRASRNDEDANVLCLPAAVLDRHKASVLAETFLSAKFAVATRFNRRIHQLDELN